MLTSPDARPFSFGEKAVGLMFNPSNDPQVQAVKAACAALIDQLNDLRGQLNPDAPESKEKARMYSIAITELQTSQMWAVKAITWKD